MLNRHGTFCVKRGDGDVAFDDDVAAPADENQMFAIIAADEDEATALIDGARFNDGETWPAPHANAAAV